MLLAARFGATALFTLALLARGVVSRTAGAASPQVGSPPAKGDGQPPKPAPARLGVVVNDPRAFQGYTLVFPAGSTRTCLVDMQGRIVRTWQCQYSPGEETYLLDNGHLLRPSRLNDSEAIFAGAGSGGRIQELTWEGQLVWNFKFHNERQIQHHAITRMPNGNIMMIVWERKTRAECLEAGVKPDASSQGDILVDSLIEISPAGKTGGKIVWEWHLWDHLVQDHDKSKPNYGDVAAHPERIDVNFSFPRGAGAAMDIFARAVAPTPKKDDARKNGSKNDASAKLSGIGYVGPGGGSKKFLGFIRDWNHVNSVSYHPKLDQLMLSSREFSEIWIIDHGTTTAEAKGRSGGRCGKGGDLLYRWGNPSTYRAGTAAQQRLFYQHDAQWIPEGLPGAGHLLVFNNGPRPTGPYSSVDEVVLPVGLDGRYEHTPGKAYGPEQTLWSYTAPRKSDFYARFMSGTQRLPNGNTLVSTGFSGSIFEVTPEKEVVWNYIVPPDSPPQARPPSGAPPRSVQLLPGLLPLFVPLAPEQRKQLEAFEKAASASLDTLLTGEQLRQLTDLQRNFDPGGPGSPTEAGRIIPWTVQDRLDLTADQRTQVADLQKKADAAFDAILTKEQKGRAWELQWVADTLKAWGGTGGTPIFRAYRYGPDFPGLAGKDLTPGQTIDELAAKPVEGKK